MSLILLSGLPSLSYLILNVHHHHDDDGEDDHGEEFAI